MAPIWDIDPVLFSLATPFFTISLRYYGLLFGLIIIGGFFLFKNQIIRGGGTEDEAFDFVVPAVLAVVLGSRFGHVFFYELDHFLEDPWWLFRIWEGGLSSHGASIALILAVFYYAKKYKRSFLDTGDRLMFSVAYGATLVRLGNFMNSEIVGKVTDASWGVRFPRYDLLPPELTPARYPSQLVEAAMGFFILIVLFILDAKWGKEKRKTGLMSAAFLILYFTGRFLVEFIKERQGAADDFIISTGQLLSLPGLFFGLAILFYSLKILPAKK